MQESDALKNSLVEKEKELCALEEKLDARERVSVLTLAFKLIKCIYYHIYKL